MGNKQVRDDQSLTEEEFLRSYNVNRYDRPSVTVDMLIFTVTDEETDNYRKLSEKSLKILLVKRGEHPFLGQWALPGGFVSIHESIEQAAQRELRTETNIHNIYMEQLCTWGEVHRDPRTRVISCSYMALVDNSSMQIKAGDDADDANWFYIQDKMFQEKKSLTEEGKVIERWIKLRIWNEDIELSATIKITKIVAGRVQRVEREIIETNGLAFDHAKLIQYGLESLRGKIEDSDIVFNLMPERFTLTELQQVYEVILGRELLAAAFRRKIANKVTETNEYTKNAGHRPSKLYRFNPDWTDTF